MMYLKIDSSDLSLNSLDPIMIYCIQGNISPHFFFAPFALTVSRQILDWVNSIVANNILHLGEFKTKQSHLQV